MKYSFLILLAAATLLRLAAPAQTIHSLGRKLTLAFRLSPAGELTYELKYGARTVVRSSRLSVLLQDAPGFDNGFTIAKVDTSRHDDTSAPVWGEVKQIRNHY